LQHGRIIYANVYKSSGRDAAGPHYAVILDSDEQVAEHDSYFAAVISHNNLMDPDFSCPVPPRTGLSGYVVCSYIQEIHLPGIHKVGPLLLAPEMATILKLVRAAQAAKAAKRSKRS
jgi:hypothetical protein